ncbi:hypothetical protein [Tenacibaculum amylolyticum]|uniref:hypothetical protein n=1 Tax=Tenacibaculum amylolyticum TaxID=104269 RepID=UPI0038943248
MKKTLPYFIVGIFSIYWLCTIIYVSPNNYIKISLLKQEQAFDIFFFQKWGFFAPPPDYNDRLYYTFHSKKDSTKAYTFEVMETLQEKKSARAPFNSSEDILDYILSNTLNSISSGLVTINQKIEYDKKTPFDSLKNRMNIIEREKNYVQSSNNFSTLKKYAEFVAKKNNLNIKDYFLTIEIVQSNMPKFADRNELEAPKKSLDNLIFKSDKINF